MDWFEHLTGFRESSYEETRAKLKVDGALLQSLVNGKSYRTGDFELVSLNDLRRRARDSASASGKLKVSVVKGDVRLLHRAREYAGALFQVASQFNALEMTGPRVTPEDGVTRYAHDHTQGPACAIAAGAATIYRNYFAPVGGFTGQTSKRQLDGLAPLGNALSRATGRAVGTFWSMENGYALCSRAGLAAISDHLVSLDADAIDALRGLLEIGLQWDAEATEGTASPGPLVSQAFCSALPVAYTAIPSAHWGTFAPLVLEAAYEATLWAAALNARRGASPIVLLTLLGGGAFGNEETWIFGAMRRALELTSGCGLDVRIVSFGSPSRELLALAAGFG